MQRSRWLGYGMVLLWGFVLSINILFRHAHRLPDGRIVSHVHPFKWTGEKGPLPYNPHSKSELSWLDVHSNTPFFGEAPQEYNLPEHVLPQVGQASDYTFCFISCRIEPENPRGPPALG